MLSVVEILRAEHRVIERILAVMLVLAQRLQSGEATPSEDLRAVVEFMRDFSDGCHHRKEEDIFFPALEQHGLPASDGPTAVMREDHARGRALVRQAAALVEAYAAGNPDAAAALAATLQNLAELYGTHIGKEHAVLFPLSARLLPEDAQAALLAQFERLEADAGGEHERLLAVVEVLTRAYPG